MPREPAAKRRPALAPALEGSTERVSCLFVVGRWPGPSLETPGGWGAEKSEASPMDRAERQRT